MHKEVIQSNFHELLEDVKGNRIRTYILFADKGTGKTKYMKDAAINYENVEYVDFLEISEEFFKTQKIIDLKYFNIDFFFKYLKKKYGINDKFILLDNIDYLFTTLNTTDIKVFFDKFKLQIYKNGLMIALSNIRVLSMEKSLLESSFPSSNIIKLGGELINGED